MGSIIPEPTRLEPDAPHTHDPFTYSLRPLLHPAAMGLVAMVTWCPCCRQALIVTFAARSKNVYGNAQTHKSRTQEHKSAHASPKSSPVFSYGLSFMRTQTHSSFSHTQTHRQTDTSTVVITRAYSIRESAPLIIKYTVCVHCLRDKSVFSERSPIL